MRGTSAYSDTLLSKLKMRLVPGWYAMSRRVQALEEATRSLGNDRHRVDVVLAILEGFMEEKSKYDIASAADEYNAVFSKDTPLISVCVGTMNRSDLLVNRCLSSILNQTYKNIEVIVVGDHCTDDTSERVAALGDPRIQFHNLDRRGPYPKPGRDRWLVAGTESFNFALSQCTGDFITHLDDDDCYSVDRLEVLTREAKHKCADFLWHPFLSENHDGSWKKIGNGRFELNQITTGSIFYHRYFARFPWDVSAYELQEPGDWNRLRKIKVLRPRLHYVDLPLLRHHREFNQRPFQSQEGETFLD